MTSRDLDIRKEFDPKTATWQFSIVDAVEACVKTSDARNYWKTLKNRLKKGDNQLVTACNQLKMKSSDGKSYLTDVANRETLLGIIKITSPSKLSVLRSWMDNIEAEIPHPIQNIEAPKDKSFPQSEGPGRTEGTVSVVGSVGTEDAVGPVRTGGAELLGDENELAVDLIEGPSMFILKAFVAGISIENFSIFLSPDTIIMHGKRTAPQARVKNYFQQELFWGSFSRNISLPYEIEIDSAQATERHGMLTITLPKLNILRARTLKIKYL